MKVVSAATIGTLVASCVALAGVWVLVGPARAGPSVAQAGATTNHAVSAADAEEPRLERTYRYAGGEAGKKAIEAAVEEAVRRMNPLVRGIARRRMLEANRVIPELGFDLSGDPLVASYVGGRLIEAPADGRPVAWTDQYGETIEVRHQLKKTTLVQTMSGSKGNRRNRYRFSSDGKTMTMAVEISSDRLPAPLRYEVAYRLAD